VTLHLTIPGDPHGKRPPQYDPRQRRTVKAAGSRTYEKAVAALARATHRAPPLDGAHVVEIAAVCRRPGARPDAVPREVWATGERCARVGKPDADNIAKAVLDGLRAGGVLRDDTVVTRLVVVRVYAARGEGPCVEVRVEAVGWERTEVTG
jgi:Holliday junction resolvase RusA-like endonuclease